jgi:hypothetical protein
MAREYAPIKLAIWADDDFRALSMPAQHLYFLLLTSPSLSHCGVADWRPNRIAALIGGATTDGILEAADELVARLFILVDEDTEEVLVRSFVRHDGLMKQPKMATAMATAHAAVASTTLRGVIVHELNRLKEDFPAIHGWGSEKATEILSKATVNPFTYPLGNGSIKGIGKGKPNPSVKGWPTPVPVPTTKEQISTSDDAGMFPVTAYPRPKKDADYAEEFNDFWSVYPLKKGKEPALKAFIKARRSGVPLEVLRAAAERYRGDVRGVEPAKVKWPQGWINDKRWQDYDEPSVTGGDVDPNEILGPDYWTPPVPPREVDDGPPHLRAEWFKAREQERKLERIETAKLTLARRSA